MKYLKILILSFLAASCSLSSNNDPAETPLEDVFNSRLTSKQLKDSPIKLIPFPQEVEWSRKKISLNGINLINSDVNDENIRIELEKILENSGLGLKKGGIDLQISLNQDISKEGYKLSVEKKLIHIQSSTYTGAFYAIQTLRQLIFQEKDKILIQSCRINDYPVYPIRGYMIDVGRNYQSMASLKNQLDIMASYKLNIFHWHLTDRPAWRIESLIYPELNAAENHRATRDPGMFYTYNDIRELISYAKKLNIQIIPEIDMPGHSDSFITSMGVRMESEKGMEILENVLKEFFSEITIEQCPIIHLGSDEVRIPNPDQFINKMVSICEDHGREVIIWNPGLNAGDQVIRQTWQSNHLERREYPEIDSWNNYVNNDEPHNIVSKLFFKPIGYGSENAVIGSILCLWPDVNLDNESDAFKVNPVYPALVSHSWACWTAGISTPHPGYLTILPAKGTEASEYFEAFETYVLDHKEKYFTELPFPYYRQSESYWKIALSDSLAGDSDLKWIPARGNTLMFKDRFKLGGYFPDARPGSVAYAERTITSKTDREFEALIGFETPLRANRVYSGMPENGKWDPNGGKIWINGKELVGPEWEYPGWKPSRSSGWAVEDQETPWRDEELYWTRKPAKILLKKGDNTFRIMAPYSHDYQNWMVTFVLLD